MVTELDETFEIETLRMVRQLALEGRPKEICGFISSIGAVIPMANIAPNPNEYFEMYAPDILNAYERIDKMGERVIAVYHSHPNSEWEWSEIDKRNWVPNLANLLVLPSGAIRIVTTGADGPVETYASAL